LKKYPNLFSPLKVGSVIIKNRIESAPMSLTELSSKEGFSRENKAFFEEIARGGAGLVVYGESVVDDRGGKTHDQQIVLSNPAIIASLTELADIVHQYDAAISIEISHGGMMSSPEINGGISPMGPSGAINFSGERVLEMDEGMMERVAYNFAAAARTVQWAGFDMCMIHAAHGWLLAQFLSPITNKRKDKYGGGLENRARFPMMVIDRVRAAVGPDFPVDLRLSGSEFIQGGFDIEEVIEFVKMVQTKVDMVHISAAAPWSPTMRMCMPIFMKRGSNVYLAAEVKKAINIPVATVGALVDPPQMEEIIATGQADIVAIGRGLVADPFLPSKAKRGNDNEIVKCIRCYVCNQTLYSTRAMKCSVNPTIGRQYDSRFIRQAPSRKRVLIAGGGPSGMQAAITAAERGHDVILCEKSGSLGGALKFARHVDFKVDIMNFCNYLERKVRSSGVEVHLDTEVSQDTIRRYPPDVLLAAVGAAPIIPAIPGIGNKNVLLAADIYNDGADIGKRVAIIGGGLVGCETGIYLFRKGKDVFIVEMLGDVAIDTTRDHKRGMMLEIRKGVKLYINHKCVRITDNGVMMACNNGNERLLEVDTVIIAVGVKPLSEVVESLRDCATDFVAIGDCKRPKKVFEAIRSGYDAAITI
jgi:2,4-dienoyl-CoA reductase-like NADH-dependent reductase (Old Yellow Enzyme family)/thioredoxin reductase